MGIANVMKMLELKDKKTHSPYDLLDIIQGGIGTKAITALEKNLDIKSVQMARILGISTKTLERYKADPRKKLTPAVSERIMRIATLKERALEVFDDDTKANGWLRSPSIALGWRAPMDIMPFNLGIDLVLNELGRIEHGLVS
jgi:putative toxin-antitoxin system antitoxin component (TIGR02293 family)